MVEQIKKQVVEEEYFSEEEELESDWYESDHEIEYQGPVMSQRYIVGTKLGINELRKYRRNAILVIDPNRLKKKQTLKRTLTKRTKIITEVETLNPEKPPQTPETQKTSNIEKTVEKITAVNVQQTRQKAEVIKDSVKKESQFAKENQKKVTNEVAFDQQEESSFSSDSNYKTSDDEQQKVQISFEGKEEKQLNVQKRENVSESVASVFNIGMEQDSVKEKAKKMVYETSNEPSQMSRIVTVEIDSESEVSHRQQSVQNEQNLAQSHSTNFMLGSSRQLGSSPIPTRPPSALNQTETIKFDVKPVQVPQTPALKPAAEKPRPSKFFNVGLDKVDLQNKSAPPKTDTQQMESQKERNVEKSKIDSQRQQQSGIQSQKATKIQDLSTTSQIKSKRETTLISKVSVVKQDKIMEQHKSAPPKSSSVPANIIPETTKVPHQDLESQNSVNSARINRRRNRTTVKKQKGKFLDPSLILQPEVIDYNTDVDKDAAKVRKEEIKDDSINKLERTDEVLSAQNEKVSWHKMSTNPIETKQTFKKKYALDISTPELKTQITEKVNNSQSNVHVIENQKQRARMIQNKQLRGQEIEKQAQMAEKVQDDMKIKKKVVKTQTVKKKFTRKIKKAHEKKDETVLSQSSQESDSENQNFESSSSSSRGEIADQSLDYYENQIDKLSSQNYTPSIDSNSKNEDKVLKPELSKASVDNLSEKVQSAEKKTSVLKELDDLKIKNERSSIVEVKQEVDRVLQMMAENKKKKPESFLKTKQQEFQNLVKNRKSPPKKISKSQLRDPISPAKSKSKFSKNVDLNSSQQKLIKVPTSSQSQRNKDRVRVNQQKSVVKYYITESESSFYTHRSEQPQQENQEGVVENSEEHKQIEERDQKNVTALKSNLKKQSTHSSDPILSGNNSDAKKSGEKRQVRFMTSTKVWVQREIKTKKVEFDLSDTDLEDFAFHRRLSDFSEVEKTIHILRLWRTCINVALSTAIFVNILLALKYKTQLFGVQLVENQRRQKKKSLKPRWFIILPNSTIKACWNALMLLLLVFLAIYLPIQVGFKETISSFELVTANVIDILFLIDVGLNFFFAFEERDGRLEFNLKRIAKNYLKAWFFVDLLAILPIQLITPQTLQMVLIGKIGENVTKAFMLIQVLRILKLLKILRYTHLTHKFGRVLKISPSQSQMINLTLACLLITHLASCLWLFSARFDDFNEFTWVSRGGFDQNSNHLLLYFESLYWALQVLTTVGYGDFGAATVFEYLINIFWMVLGVMFYQIIFAQIVSIMNASSLHYSIIDEKLQHLEQFQREKGMPEELYENFRQYLLNNHLELFTRIDEQKLLDELPKTLKFEVLLIQYGPLVERIGLLRDSDNSEFVWEVVQKAQKIFFDKNEVIYMPGDYVETFFMIFEGSCQLVTPSGHIIQKYSQGDLLRNNDALLGLPCDGRCIALESCTLYQVKVADLIPIFARMPKMQRKMEKQALMKKHRHERIKAILKRKFPEVTQLVMDGKLGMIQEAFIRKLRDYGVEAINKRRKIVSQKFSSRFYQNKDQKKEESELLDLKKTAEHEKAIISSSQLCQINQYLNQQKQILSQSTDTSQQNLQIWKFLPQNNTSLSTQDRQNIIQDIQQKLNKDQRQNDFGKNQNLLKIQEGPQMATEQQISQTIDILVSVHNLGQAVKAKSLNPEILDTTQEGGPERIDSGSCQNIESQAVIQILNNFNSDMARLNQGLGNLKQLLAKMDSQNKFEQSQYESLQKSVIETVERQKNFDIHCEKISIQNEPPKQQHLDYKKNTKKRTTFSGLDPSDLAHIQEQKNLAKISSTMKVIKIRDDESRQRGSSAAGINRNSPTKNLKNPQSRTGSSF